MPKKQESDEDRLLRETMDKNILKVSAKVPGVSFGEKVSRLLVRLRELLYRLYAWLMKLPRRSKKYALRYWRELVVLYENMKSWIQAETGRIFATLSSLNVDVLFSKQNLARMNGLELSLRAFVQRGIDFLSQGYWMLANSTSEDLDRILDRKLERQARSILTKETKRKDQDSLPFNLNTAHFTYAKSTIEPCMRLINFGRESLEAEKLQYNNRIIFKAAFLVRLLLLENVYFGTKGELLSIAILLPESILDTYFRFFTYPPKDANVSRPVKGFFSYSNVTFLLVTTIIHAGFWFFTSLIINSLLMSAQCESQKDDDSTQVTHNACDSTLR